MDFLTQHVTEVLIAIEIGITVYLLKTVQTIMTKQAVMEREVSHINKAVNNVEPGEKSLRQVVAQMNEVIERLEKRTRERTQERYE